MTIRARLTAWYVSISLASIFLMAGGMYYELVTERAERQAEDKPAELVPEEIFEIVLFYGLPTALVTIIGGWILLRKALSPLDKLVSAAQRLHVHNLREPLPRTGNGDEVDRLTEALNATNARLEDSFNRIREFTLHASHELKTPLAVMHGEIETALADPATTAAQREVFASQLDEIQRLAKIVEGLTLLAKADAGQVPLSRKAVRLDELVQDSFADALILAQPQKIAVNLAACDEVTLLGDRHRLRQLLLNLTDNAIKYNRPGGRMDMRLTRNGANAELTITNTGKGISPSALRRVFDRFYRGDESHNSGIEGCGLGLSIAEWIVKAHGGGIQITSELEKSTTVTVSLPLPPSV
jgi:signal transduction histidine kinase